MNKWFTGREYVVLLPAAMIMMLFLTRCAIPQELAGACKYRAAYIEGDSCLVSSVPVENDFYKNEPYYLPCMESVNVPTVCMAANYASGQVAIRMHTRDWQIEGQMTVYYPNGKRREERMYVNDNYGREYTTWYENGQVEREVIPVRGTKLSRYKTWGQGGELVAEGFYTYSDTLSRPLYDSIINSWATGQQMVRNGNGAFVHYYANGRMSSELPIVNGKAEGVMRTWDTSGVVIEEISYSKGKPHGSYHKADGQGRTLTKGYYKNGAKDSTWTEYYLTGAVRSQKNYRSGSECGQFCEWYENGQKALEYHTSAGGKMEGEERQWHENGQLKCAGTYENGYRHGTFAWFNEDGTRDFETQYNAGRELSTICYRNGKRLKRCPQYRL